MGKLEAFVGLGWWMFQLILVGITVATALVFWLLRVRASFLDTLLYTLVVGNFTMTSLGASERLLRQPTPLRGWAAFLGLLLPIGFVGAVLASLTLYGVDKRTHSQALWGFLVDNVEFGLLVTLLVGIALFAVNSTRDRLEAANRRLQDQVQLGMIRLQDLAADLAAAHEIQAHLIPTNFPQVAGVQVSGAWQPAQAVGGDYFDVLMLERRRLGITIADVAGKGMGAALLMANLQAAFRALATDEVSPGALCGKLNRALCSSIAPAKFVTFFYGILDVGEMRLRYENAGHNPPILLREGEAIPLPGGGTVLGLFAEAAYEEREISLRRGDCLLLTTDGVTEAANPADLEDEFGEARLIEAAKSVRGQGAHAMRARILEDVTKFCGGQFRDDASLILVVMEDRRAG